MSVTVRPWDDPRSWNDFVTSTSRPHFQQSWQWGEVASALGARPVRLMALCGRQPVAAAQIFVTPIGRIAQRYLYVPRGPAACQASVETLGPLFDAARGLGHETSAIGLKIEPNAEASDRDWRWALAALGLRPSYPPSQPRSTWVLDIVPDDDLLAGMKQKTRYNLRLAARKGVEVHEVGPEELDAFYDLYAETARRDDFTIHSRPVYRRLVEAFAENFRMLFARLGDELLAAVTVIRFGRTCWYLHGASSNAHRNLMAPYLLQWEAIRWARDQGCAEYDFRGVPDVLREDQDMYGVYRFKAGFGGRKVTVLDAYAAPYHFGWFGLWQLYLATRFRAMNWSRRRRRLPIRQSA